MIEVLLALVFVGMIFMLIFATIFLVGSACELVGHAWNRLRR